MDRSRSRLDRDLGTASGGHYGTYLSPDSTEIASPPGGLLEALFDQTPFDVGFVDLRAANAAAVPQVTRVTDCPSVRVIGGTPSTAS